MIKKLKSSLTFKIFLITTLLLVFVSATTYGFIAYFMPKSYSSKLSAELEDKVQNFLQVLSEINYSEVGPLFKEFEEKNNVNLYVLSDDKGWIASTESLLQLYELGNSGESGTEIDTEDLDITESQMDTEDADITESQMDTEDADITESQMDTEDADITESQMDTEDADITESQMDTENADITESQMNTEDMDIAESVFNTEDMDIPIESDDGFGGGSNSDQEEEVKYYPLKFADLKNYELQVVGKSRVVNQAAEVLRGILPYLFLTILSISLLSGILYSFYITRPVISIQKIAKRMTTLDFTSQCQERRTDEIGQLAISLNQLSDKLSSALEELRQANASLKDDIEKERELEQKRLEFFSAVSHELKTPITVIKGQLDGMIQKIGAYTDRDKYLVRAYEKATTMEDIVQELLTVSRMESKDFHLKKQNINLTELLLNSIRDHEDMFMMKEMVLEKRIDSDLIIEGDPRLIKKVINNLINNGILYSPSKQRMKVTSEDLQDENVIQIENTGVHIPEDQLDQLFVAFYRVEKSRNRRTGGSGLGLYIVKMILDLHDFTYKIQNSKEGVCFTIKINKNL